MRSSSVWLALLVAPGLLFAPPALGAGFDYEIDRFEVSGQVSFVDAFDDGVVAPWSANFGTVAEAGGLLSLQSPGTELSALALLGGPTLDVSSAIAPASANVSDGGGDFVVESNWTTLPGPPSGPLGGFYGLQLFAVLPSAEPTCVSLAAAAGEATVLEVVAVVIAVRNFQTVPTPFTGPAGLAVGTNVSRTCVAGLADPLDNRVYSRVPGAVTSIDPVSVTGDIVLRLAFSDLGNTLAPSFSLDSGASFSGIGPALAFDDFSSSAGRFQLLAQPILPPPLPVPALPGWGLGVLAAGIAAAGARARMGRSL